ncbi:hypothetical protein QYE76_006352 [Lolium multiflorum]|uniref:Uncharacterized protein n=1 Tax=Lolium multiflorum TaxID=4521 RepID=A0AAD8RWI8_LOLMU|nr:hypothetical protein QYE76_006352 [Lolium multiflorum]
MVKLAALVVAVALLALLDPAATVVEFAKEDLESDDSLWKLYELWGARHKVARHPGEKLRRFAIFKEQARRVYDLHIEFAGDTPLGLNSFADLSDDEVRRDYRCAKGGAGNGRKKRSFINVKRRTGDGTLPLPVAFDWRSKTCYGHPCLTPVKDQAYNCGACWAFAATAAMESHHAILKNGSLLRLSEQELVDCDTNNGACAGGLAANAFQYVVKWGLTSSAAYPYTARNGTCKSSATFPVLGMTGFARVPAYDEFELLQAVTYGPVVVSIDANNTEFDRYAGGLYPSVKCGRTPDHEMLLVGYGSNHYILRNSYGENWGDKGYMLLPRNFDLHDVFGPCGILLDGATYPEMA